MTKIKICGLSRSCDIDAVNEAKPEYVGFVFAGSPRQISPAKALSLRKKLDLGITPVGVFVQEEAENVLFLVRNGVIDAIQLHGGEDEEYMMKIKALTDVPIIKAVSVTKTGDVQKWQNTCADYLLFDHKGGGSGKSFDWHLIGHTNKPFFLAGGLTIENVPEAISRLRPFAVDVSSGVETDGLKDRQKIISIVRRIRNA